MKRIEGIPEYEESPFISTVPKPGKKKRRRVEIVYDGTKAVINRDTGEYEPGLQAARTVWVEETEQFLMLYVANMAIFFELSRAAQRVCEFVLRSMCSKESMGTDLVHLHYEDYAAMFDRPGRSDLGSSEATFKRGLRELVAKALIAKRRRADQWFVNPYVIFNGDQASFITKVRLRREDKGKVNLIKE